MADEKGENCKQFHEFGLDDRLLKAISKLKWAKPTLIQESAIPLALEGKDILARAKTGSGKTAAYAIPIIHKILKDKQIKQCEPSVKALILVPTKELAQQSHKNMKELTSYCSRDVRIVDVAQATLDVMRPVLLEKPDVIIGTPSRVLGHLQAKNFELKDSLKMLVVDEADLVFSYGYEYDLKTLLSHLPKIYQAFLMSATLSQEVQELKKLVLQNPVTLKLDDSDLPAEQRLTQYLIKCEADEKFLLIYTLLKLKLVRGKTLIFVNGIDRCYRLKLFLEQFSIKSCVLNSELPHNSRCHIVEEFNKGIYDYIIATDENVDTDISKTASRKKFKGEKDKEYGVSRGIDFQDVENVLNFDFSTTVEDYVHRVGRTARGHNTGNALSLVTHSDGKIIDDITERLSPSSGQKTEIFKPFKFKMEEIEGFRYRAKDALRAVTKSSVKEARLKEIKSEILNSEKLKAYFEDNPRDLQLLRHDKDLHPAKIHPHLKHVPEYLVPETLKPTLTKLNQRKRSSYVPFHKKSQQQNKKQKLDPLRTFKSSQKAHENKRYRKTRHKH